MLIRKLVEFAVLYFQPLILDLIVQLQVGLGRGRCNATGTREIFKLSYFTNTASHYVASMNRSVLISNDSNITVAVNQNIEDPDDR